jgi:phosphoglycerol transferase
MASRLRVLGLPKPFATLTFGKNGTLESAHEVRGLAEPEDWGVWSEGEVVEIGFREQLPASFELVIQARAFGPNAQAAIALKVGNVSQSMTMKGPRKRTYRFRFSGQNGQWKISFVVPYPVSPAELNPSGSSDHRKIGLGLISMLVAPILGD